jgi:hypothetical protein
MVRYALVIADFGVLGIIAPLKHASNASPPAEIVVDALGMRGVPWPLPKMCRMRPENYRLRRA